MKKYTLLVLILAFYCNPAHADEIHLKNGDKITGSIINDTSSEIRIETDAMGTIAISREYVKEVLTDEDIAFKKVKDSQESKRFKQSVSVGISNTQGNTTKSSFSFEYNAQLKREKTDWDGRLSAYRSSEKRKEDTRKYYGLMKRSYHFGALDQWDQIIKLEGDQDRFSNIDYRIIPSAGFGYWFKKEDDFKLMVEGLIGFERTSYRDGSETENTIVFVPRGLFEKLVIGNLTLKEDVTLYPSLEDFEKYRLRAETVLSQPIAHNLSWKLSFIQEYDSKPKGDTKKNDTHLIAAIDYAF